MGKNTTPEEETRRKLILKQMSKAKVMVMDGVHTLFKETIEEFLEDSRDAELEEMLDYCKYDHTGKTESGTTSARSGHGWKTQRTSAGKKNINILHDQNGEFVSRILSQDNFHIHKGNDIPPGHSSVYYGYFRHGYLVHKCQPDNGQNPSRSSEMPSDRLGACMR